MSNDPYIFLNELIISTDYDRTVQKYNQIFWSKSSHFYINDDRIQVELTFKQIDLDGEHYTMAAEYLIGDMTFGFDPDGTLNQIYELCEKFKEFYLSLRYNDNNLGR